MKKNGGNNDVFKTLTEAHNRLWESLYRVLPHFQSPEKMDAWRETYLKNLAAWEDAVKRALATESAWLENWTKQMASKQGIPESVSGWMQQVEGVMQHLVQAQSKVWNECFKMLGGSVNVQQPAKPEAAVKLEVAVEPDKRPESVKGSAESEVAMESLKPSDKPQEKDNLRTISGLGPVLEKRLNAYGIANYRQIAMLTDEEIKHIETSVLNQSGYIHRHNWIEQAKQQHFQKYNEEL